MKSKTLYADLDDLVFETRNKDYGAYDIRKRYNKFLLRAALIAFVIFSAGILSPKIYGKFLGAGELTEDSDKDGVIETVIWEEPPIPEEDIIIPPKVEITPPKIDQIKFEVPVPTPDNQVIDDATIAAIDLVEASTPGTEDVDGTEDGYDFGAIESEGTVVGEIEIVEEDPKPGDWINVEKEPQTVNMDDISRLIGYPVPAKEAEIEGQVVLRILVGKTGKYERHIVLRDPHKLLTKAVTDQISALQFTPAIQAGNPVKMWVTIPFDFKLMR